MWPWNKKINEVKNNNPITGNEINLTDDLDETLTVIKQDDADNAQAAPEQTQEMTSETTNIQDAETIDDIQLSSSSQLKEEEEKSMKEQKKRNNRFKYKVLQTIFTASFIVFTLLLINEILIQPYRSKKAMERIEELYQINEEDIATTSDISDNPSTSDNDAIAENTETNTVVETKDPKKDDQGRLLYYTELLAINEDVKGWIKVPDTNINYVVVQSSNDDPEYYLRRNIFGEDDKAGTLFIDAKSSVEENTQNLVIHGHNMYSTGTMFHLLTEYKNIDFYKERPIISFDTIYQTGKWKVFAVFITNGTDRKEPLFDYTRSEFTSSSDFLNFVYQLRIRSLFLMDEVDIREDDQLLTLSTCSYEVKDYRTVIVARKVRVDEDLSVNVDNVIENPRILYPDSFYYRYGGKAPKLPYTFEAALEAGEISWYQPEEKMN